MNECGASSMYTCPSANGNITGTRASPHPWGILNAQWFLISEEQCRYIAQNVVLDFLYECIECTKLLSTTSMCPMAPGPHLLPFEYDIGLVSTYPADIERKDARPGAIGHQRARNMLIFQYLAAGLYISWTKPLTKIFIYCLMQKTPCQLVK